MTLLGGPPSPAHLRNEQKFALGPYLHASGLIDHEQDRAGFMVILHFPGFGPPAKSARRLGDDF